MTRDEKDASYLAAGFNPDFPVVDNGTDATTVRFFQSLRPVLKGPDPIPLTPPSNVPGPGDDLRDFPQGAPVSTIGPVAPGTTTDEFGEPVLGGALAIAGRALRLIMGGGGGRLTAAIWNSLPGIVRTALTQIGIGAGAMIAFNGDIPFITLPGQNSATAAAPFDPTQEGAGSFLESADGSDASMINPHAFSSGDHAPAAAHIVGSWVANGVTFYRLIDGKIAVQNKKGRWKVWKPRKPIVLYADGASNLKTMLRADKALNKQSKKIAAMLNRRSPRPRSKAKDDKPSIIVAAHSRIIE